MELYLVQHGEAKGEEEDPQRPLTDEGRAEVEMVARYAKGYATPSSIMHSPKLRARQTAEIFSSILGTAAQETEGLKPLDDPAIARELIEGQDGNVMLVGHLPHLSRLASLLVTDDEDSDIIKFRKGAIVCLENDEGWRVKWMLTPGIVRR